MPTPNLSAIILAAGRGERLRPHTDTTPKPLLPVRGKPLAQWHLEALARAGVTNVVINTAWLEAQFEPVFGRGERFGLSITYSHEGRDHGGALETAGGIAKALPLLGDAFWVVSGDVFVPGFGFDATQARRFRQSQALLAKLWLVANAPHHPKGDFGIDAASGLATDVEGVSRLTWASIGLFRAEMFKDIVAGTKLPLRPLLDAAMRAGTLAAERWDGAWTDVGTVERWQALNNTVPDEPLDTSRPYSA
jgi:N-acetyl-alpha-D-muramate 1-phosphate uridylyltransferase